MNNLFAYHKDTLVWMERFTGM